MGISVENCEFSSLVQVANNSLKLLPGINPPPIIGIQILESGLVADNVELLYNNMTNWASGHGVFVNRGNTTSVRGCVVGLGPYADFESNNAGINAFYFEGGNSQFIRCNQARQWPAFSPPMNTDQMNYLQPPVLQYSGFKINGATGWALSENFSQHMQNSFKFEGNSVSPALSGAVNRGMKGNGMRLSYTGILLEQNAQIGPQGSPTYRPDNRFCGGTANSGVLTFGSGFGAMSNELGAVTTSRFHVSDIPPTGYDCINPPTNLPGWFTAYPELKTYPVTCGQALFDVGPTEIEDEPGEFVEGGLTDWDYLIAQDSLPAEQYRDEMLWQSQMDLYLRLLADSALLVGDSIIQQFYDQHRLATVGQIAAIEGKLAAVLAYGETELAELAGLRSQLATATGALAYQDSLLGIAPTFEDSLTLIGVRGDYLSAVDSLRNLYEMQLPSFRSDRQSLLEGVLHDLSQLSANAPYEANYKNCYTILVEIALSESQRATEGQRIELTGIASQCPLSGGKAVFLARSLLRQIIGAHDYYDKEICFGEGIGYRPSAVHTLPASDVRLYPNPADRMLTLEHRAPLSEAARIELYNSMGQPVFARELEVGTRKQQIEVAFLQEGIYMYRVSTPSRTLASGTLMISR